MFDQIFRMQRDLNIHIGRDTVGADEAQRHAWVFQYLYAAKVEAGELLDCFTRDTLYLPIENEPNSKVELIDIMHFVVSACQLVGITTKDIPFFIDTPNFSLFNAVFSLDRELELLATKYVDFKWWSKTVKADPSRQFTALFNIEELRRALIGVFVDMIIVAHLLGMTDDDILAIYKLKHAKNIKRQEDNYDVRTKTEADNQQIEAQIKADMSKRGLTDTTVPIDDLSYQNIIANVRDLTHGSPLVEKTVMHEIDPGCFTTQGCGCNLSHLLDETLCPTTSDQEVAEISIGQALGVLKKHMDDDPDYAWSIQANLAMSFYDATPQHTSHEMTHKIANEGAARFMKLFFDVDMTKQFPHRFDKSIRWSDKYRSEPTSDPKSEKVLINHFDFMADVGRGKIQLTDQYSADVFCSWKVNGQDFTLYGKIS